MENRHFASEAVAATAVGHNRFLPCVAFEPHAERLPQPDMRPKTTIIHDVSMALCRFARVGNGLPVVYSTPSCGWSAREQAHELRRKACVGRRAFAMAHPTGMCGLVFAVMLGTSDEGVGS